MDNKKKLVNSILHSVMGKYVLYIVQFVTIVVVARLYTPKQLGYFAILQLMLTFFSVITNSGLGAAVINEKKLSHKDKGGLFSFTALLGVGLCALSFILSPLISVYFNYSNFYDDVIWIIPSLLLQSLLILPNAFLLKDKCFYKVSFSACLAEIISLIYLLIEYYLFEGGVELLAKKVFIFTVFKFLLVLYFSRNTKNGLVYFGSSLSSIKKYINFTLYQMSFSFINFFTRNLDSILIGKYFGMHNLGLYDRAYQLMRYPLQLVTFALVPAIQPNIVELKNKEEVVKIHNWLIEILSFISIFICFFLSTSSDKIIALFFGSEWSDSSATFFIFCFMVPSQILMSSSGGFFQACNAVKVLFWSGLVSAVCNVIAITAGIYLGTIESVAICLLISFSINLFQTYYCLYKYVFQASFYNFIYSLRSALINILALIVPFLFFQNVDLGINDFYSLILYCITYVLFSLPVFVFNYRRWFC